MTRQGDGIGLQLGERFAALAFIGNPLAPSSRPSGPLAGERQTLPDYAAKAPSRQSSTEIRLLEIQPVLCRYLALHQYLVHSLIVNCTPGQARQVISYFVPGPDRI